jgi:hypothetical protein
MGHSTRESAGNMDSALLHRGWSSPNQTSQDRHTEYSVFGIEEVWTTLSEFPAEHAQLPSAKVSGCQTYSEKNETYHYSPFVYVQEEVRFRGVSLQRHPTRGTFPSRGAQRP